MSFVWYLPASVVEGHPQDHWVTGLDPWARPSDWDWVIPRPQNVPAEAIADELGVDVTALYRGPDMWIVPRDGAEQTWCPTYVVIPQG